MIQWAAVARNFVPDGSLCDIYVLGTDLEDWNRVLGHLAKDPTNLRFSVDGREQSGLPSAEAALAIRPLASPLLHVAIGGITFACHFFAADEIEFDFVPAKIDGRERLETLLGFVETLGQLTGKRVVVSPENSPALAFLGYDPLQSTVELIHA